MLLDSRVLSLSTPILEERPRTLRTRSVTSKTTKLITYLVVSMLVHSIESDKPLNFP